MGSHADGGNSTEPEARPDSLIGAIRSANAGWERKRIAYLDGLRGVAILLVVIFHYWGPLHPWTPDSAETIHLTIIAQGWVGVPLFFLVSGFVISGSVQRSKGLQDFLIKRYARLLPAMAMATVVLLIFRQFIHPGPNGLEPKLLDALPGLVFVSPAFFNVFDTEPIRALDGVFWTLFVEASFYVCFGFFYFRFGMRRATLTITLLAAMVISARFLADNFEFPRILEQSVLPFEWLGINYFIWFASGVVFAQPFFGKFSIYAAIILGMVAAVLHPVHEYIDSTTSDIATIAVVILFASAQRLRSLQNILSRHWLVFMGFISYPLYLTHNAIGFGIISLFTERMPSVPWMWIPWAGLVVILCLATAIARLEAPLRRKMFGWRNTREGARRRSIDSTGEKCG